MDLTQRKLTRAEWNNIEIPVSSAEKQIITMICQGYHDINIVFNHTKSLLTYLKIAQSLSIEQYVFEKYIVPELQPMITEFGITDLSITKKKKHIIKKADIIRFSNTDQYLSTQKKELYEFIIIDLFRNMYQAKQNQNVEEKTRKKHNLEIRERNETTKAKPCCTHGNITIIPL